MHMATCNAAVADRRGEQHAGAPSTLGTSRRNQEPERKAWDQSTKKKRGYCNKNSVEAGSLNGLLVENGVVTGEKRGPE